MCVLTIHFASSTTRAKCNKIITITAITECNVLTLRNNKIFNHQQLHGFQHSRNDEPTTHKYIHTLSSHACRYKKHTTATKLCGDQSSRLHFFHRIFQKKSFNFNSNTNPLHFSLVLNIWSGHISHSQDGVMVQQNNIFCFCVPVTITNVDDFCPNFTQLHKRSVKKWTWWQFC